MRSMGVLLNRDYCDIRVWTTMAELDFIEKLGSFSMPTSLGGDSFRQHRIKCLKGYIEGWEKRTNWGKIDKWAAKAQAEKQLNKELYNKGGDEE